MLESEKKIHYEVASLQEQVQKWKSERKKIVFTNGCFDIIHLGHLDYLEKARQLGDKLIVAINTDSSIQKLKGSTRPVIKEHSRLRHMAGLFYVDAVIPFSENTPKSLIHTLEPDILVKGGDYSVKNIIGAEFVISRGGSVVIIPLLEGYSTSNIIDFIKKN